jgi:hypothetical protein
MKRNLSSAEGERLDIIPECDDIQVCIITWALAQKSDPAK